MPLGSTILARGLLGRLAENWWKLLLRGIVAIVFGVVAFYWPGATLLSLAYVWGIYALADGMLALWAAISGDGADTSSRWWLAFVGITGIAAGLATFFWPGITALALLMLIAAWAIVTGVMQIWGAIQLRREIDGEWLLILSGLLSIVFGIFLFAQPDAGALAVVYTIGIFAILIGCLYVVFAFRLKSYKIPA
jgi:uncharacterized membrane protein HdeD (DUF308 family)